MVNKKIKERLKEFRSILNTPPASTDFFPAYTNENKLAVDVIDILNDYGLADRVDVDELIKRARNIAKKGNYTAYKNRLVRKR